MNKMFEDSDRWAEISNEKGGKDSKGQFKTNKKTGICVGRLLMEQY